MYERKETSIPCIVCGNALDRVFESEAQPNDGVMFSTSGNYGSTVIDDMNGNFITIIVCDRCLKRAGEQKRVLTDKRYENVMAPSVANFGDRGGERLIETVIGSHRLYRPYVHWTADTPPDDQVMHFEPDEVLAHLDDDRNFEWNLGKDLTRQLCEEAKEFMEKESD